MSRETHLSFNFGTRDLKIQTHYICQCFSFVSYFAFRKLAVGKFHLFFKT